MTLIPHQHQMNAKTTVGLRVTPSWHTPAAHKAQVQSGFSLCLTTPDDRAASSHVSKSVARGLGRRFVRRSLYSHCSGASPDAVQQGDRSPLRLVATNSKHSRSLIPAVVWAGPERRKGCSGSRSHFIQPTNQLRRQAFADLSHLFIAFREPGSDEQDPNERRPEACSRNQWMRFNP